MHTYYENMLREGTFHKDMQFTLKTLMHIQQDHNYQ